MKGLDKKFLSDIKAKINTGIIPLKQETYIWHKT